MKIELNNQFKSFAGEDFKGLTMGQMLAEALGQGNKGNSIKLYSWALKFYNKEAVEMDDTDFDVLKGLVETTEVLNNLFKAQLLLEFEKLKK